MAGSKRFEDKTAFITGAASGIGRATAVAFAAEGANVVATDRSEAALQETVDRAKSARGRYRTGRQNLWPHRLRIQQRRR